MELTSRTGSGNLGIENTNIKTASGVSLDDHQKTLVGSVLDVRVLERQFNQHLQCLLTAR